MNLPETDEKISNIGVNLFRIRALIRIINYFMEEGCFDTITLQDIMPLISIILNHIEKVYKDFDELEKSLGI